MIGGRQYSFGPPLAHLDELEVAVFHNGKYADSVNVDNFNDEWLPSMLISTSFFPCITEDLLEEKDAIAHLPVVNDQLFSSCFQEAKL